jgi:hypothetical protein
MFCFLATVAGSAFLVRHLRPTQVVVRLRITSWLEVELEMQRHH